MSEAVSIVKGIGIPWDGEAAQNHRIEQAVARLREGSADQRVFIAGKERDGVVPVTLARWLSADRIVISEMSVTARCWDPKRFAQELGPAHLTERQRAKGAMAAAEIAAEATGSFQVNERSVKSARKVRVS